MTKPPLRVIFAGTPEFAARHLSALIDSEHQLIAVYTQPDRPAGRGKKIQASPVKQLAQSAAIDVYQPPSLKDEAVRDTMAALAADVMVVVAYGLILPQAILDTPAHGCLNVHASLLPRWRGAAPIQRAIEAGDERTGITIMQMDAGLDTGDMLATTTCAVDGHSAASLHDELALAGPPLLLQVLADLPHFQARAEPQNDSNACYADKISKAEAHINWQSGAAQLERAIRAFNPFPVCYSLLGDERVKIWEAERAPGAGNTAPAGTIVEAGSDGIVVSCGEGDLIIRTLQLPGGRPLSAEQMLNARSALFTPGARFNGAPAEPPGGPSAGSQP